MKRSGTWILLAVIIAVLVLLKIFVFKKKEIPAPVGAGKPGGMPPALVSGYMVQLMTIDNATQAIGTLVANEMVELKAEASGKIVKLNFREGQYVQAGTLLVKINDADLQAQWKKLQAQLKLARQKAGRLEDLRKIEGVSQEDLDIANTEIETILADIDQVEAQIAKTELKAPFAGKIGIKNVSLGSYLSPSVTVATLQQLNPIKLDFTLPQKYADNIREGQRVSFSMEGKSGKYEAVVIAIDPSIDLNTRTVRVRAQTPNPGGAMLPGGFASVDVGLDKLVNAMMVPTEAIVPVLKGKKIFVSRNGVAAEVKVQTGLRNEKMIEIISDSLFAGDTVLITGIMGLKAGAPLKFKQVR